MVLTALSVISDGDLGVEGAGGASQFAQVAVVDAVAAANGPGADVVAVRGTLAGALAVGRAAVSGGHATRARRALFVAARVRQVCGQNVA
jgi:hypothetical protein